MSKEVLNKQKKLFALLCVFAFVVVIGVTYIFSQDQTKSIQHKKMVDLPGDKIKPQELWMNRIESKNDLISQRVKFLEKLVLESQTKESEKELENTTLRREIANLKEEIRKKPQKSTSYLDPLFGPSEEEEIEPLKPPLTELVMEGTSSKVLHVDQVIPAGTTVRAILVSSVDAPCGVNASSDPQPVKLRIIDHGHLPKKVIAKLKGGIIIAAVRGELSSERVYARLERLTQVKENGEFIETEVTGYVTGEDGKYGIRGDVVDKSAKLVGNAAISGMFSGLSQYLQSTANSKYCNLCNSGCCEHVSNSYGFNLAKEGGVKGASSAFDMLTEYYIKRAEQIRPVIQIEAGRMVDITFTHSAELGDLYTTKKVEKIREQSRGG